MIFYNWFLYCCCWYSSFVTLVFVGVTGNFVVAGIPSFVRFVFVVSPSFVTLVFVGVTGIFVVAGIPSFVRFVFVVIPSFVTLVFVGVTGIFVLLLFLLL